MSDEILFTRNNNLENPIGNPFTNDLERVMDIIVDGKYELKLGNNVPVYVLRNQTFITYRKILTTEQQYSIVKHDTNLDSFDVHWGENAYCGAMKLYYFLNIKKGYEYLAIDFLFLKDNSNCIIWGTLKDGTICPPETTREFIQTIDIAKREEPACAHI